MSLERRFSKAKANGNRVVFTEREIIPVTFPLDGLLYDGAEFGQFRVPGRDMICTGYRADIRLPAADRAVQLSVSFYTGEGTIITGTDLNLSGVTAGDEKAILPSLNMPSGSTWKLVIAASGSEEEFYPQGIVVTLYLRFANGVVTSAYRSGKFTAEGIGFTEVGNLIVQ